MYLAIDVGASKIKMNVYKDTSPKSLVKSKEIETTRTFIKDLDNILDFASTIERLDAVGIALPGFIVDKSIGIISAANLPDWEEKDLRGIVCSRLGTDKVFLVHDGEAHAISEHAWRDTDKDYLFIAWGTGIGATYIRRSGKSVQGQQIEFGFQYVKGRTLESLVGGGYLEKRFGIAPSELSGENWTNIVDDFSEGLANMIALNYPKHIIWGGGVALKNKSIVDKIMEEASKKYPYWEMPTYEFAHFDAEGAVVGVLGAIKINLLR